MLATKPERNAFRRATLEVLRKRRERIGSSTVAKLRFTANGLRSVDVPTDEALADLRRFTRMYGGPQHLRMAFAIRKGQTPEDLAREIVRGIGEQFDG